MMSATKYQLEINTETLSIDSIKSLLFEVIENLGKEVKEGHLVHDDGDRVIWKMKENYVEF